MAKRGRPRKNPIKEDFVDVSANTDSSPPFVPAPADLAETNLRLREDILFLKEEKQKAEAALEKANKLLESMASNKYKDAATNLIYKVRKQVFQICDCKRKAYLKECERYSCKHLLNLCEDIEELLVADGVFKPMNVERKKDQPVGSGRVKADDYDIGWVNKPSRGPGGGALNAGTIVLTG